MKPPRPDPSQVFIRPVDPTILNIDWRIVVVLVFGLAFGGLFWFGVSTELSRHDKFVRQAEIVRICADGTRIYKVNDGYCSWLCRERFSSPDVCQ